MKILLVSLLFAILGFLTWKNLTIPRDLGVREGKLAPCSSSPRCVSSQTENPRAKIPPLAYSPGALERISQFMMENYKATVIKKTPDYLHLVITSPIMHYKDDVEFYVNKGKGTIDVRSSARIGYWDMDVNRSRIEYLRSIF